MRLLTAWMFIAASVALTGCVKRAERNAFVVTVRAAANGCSIWVAGSEVTLDRLSGISRRQIEQTRRVRVEYDEETPYRCIGAAIYTLQRAGFESVDARAGPAVPAR